MALAVKVTGSSPYGRPVRTENDIAHPVLRNLYGYWVSRCGDRVCPARADLDPVDIPRLLPHIVIVDVQLQSGSFRVRLAGTEVVRWNGLEITGKQLKDIHSSETAAIIEEYRQTALDQMPRLSSGPLENTFGSHKNVQRLLLPLSNDGVTANMIIGGIIFDRSLINTPEELNYHLISSELGLAHRAG